MLHIKGTAIATWKPWKVIPLFIPDDEGDQRWALLPRFIGPNVAPEHCIPPSKRDSAQHRFIQRLLRCSEPYSSPLVSSIVAALTLVQDGYTETTLSLVNDEENGHWSDDLEAVDVVQQSWALVRESIPSYGVWKMLIHCICRGMYIADAEHPMLAYANHQVPYLTSDELKDVVRLMKLNNQRQSPLAVQKLLRDGVLQSTKRGGGPLRPYLVLPTPLDAVPESGTNERVDVTYRHSCLPTAQLELQVDGSVAITALCGCDDVSLCHARYADGVEERDKALQQRLGSSCTCLRCRYEMEWESSNGSEGSIPLNLSVSEACQLAHCYMSLGANHRQQAKRLYQFALKQHSKKSTRSDNASLVAEIYHALGAIELSLGKFLAAQRIWHRVIQEGEEACKHTGISLQLEKIQAYEYLSERNHLISDPIEPTPPWTVTSPIPGVFVVSVLDTCTCEEIIQWADKLGTWTKQRHYEVPTHDVPVHTIPVLLTWFQHQFMTPIMQKVLAQCFSKKEGCFHVHDAFCVRYEAGLSSNHLPIHTDESTHSFVLALNDDFDGGGTYFYDEDLTIRPAAGSVLCFSGDEMAHGGDALTRGARYILTAFLYYDEDILTNNVASDRPKRCPNEPSDTSVRKAKLPKSDFSFGFSIE